MIKLLIADDEPLICVGIQSLLDWESLGVTVIGTARNGAQALEIIDAKRPEIVIADIKMPIKSGLELAEECAKKYGYPPLFILLTSYESFSFAQKAVTLQVVDYLTKLDLSEEQLKESMIRAIKRLRELNLPDAILAKSTGSHWQDKFFIRLYNNLFQSDQQYRAQQEEFGINLDYPAFVTAYCTIHEQLPASTDMNAREYTFNNVVKTIRETLGNKFDYYITALDLQHFNFLFCLSEQDKPEHVAAALQKNFTLLWQYFNVEIHAGLGHLVHRPSLIHESYSTAQRAARLCTPQQAVIMMNETTDADLADEFQFAKMHSEFCKAFEELDPQALDASITKIAEYIKAQPALQIQALDVACNILYMAIGMLPDGAQTVAEIFSAYPDNYRSIYRLKSTAQVTGWLLTLRDGCCARLAAHHTSYQKRLVMEIQEYIKANIGSHFTLNAVAAVFNFSPSHLSRLFSQYAGTGFIDYVAREKVQVAKGMLREGRQIYEVAEKLGFSSAYYFSTVFKKYEGRAPKDYQKQSGAKGLQEKAPG